MKCSTIAKTVATCAVAAFVLGLVPLAKAQARSCSNETIMGPFARRDTGFLVPPNAVPIPLAGVSLMTFDGEGTWTSVGFGSLNGNQVQSMSKGTYTVNPDCTGHYEPDVAPPGRTGGAFFVIVDGGNGLEIHPTDHGAVVSCVARRVFSVGDLEN